MRNIFGIAMAVAVFTCGSAAAAGMTKDEYKAGKDSIKANYKTAKAGCDSFAANANDICVAEAKGKQAITKAEFEEGYKPSKKNRYNVSVAKADAAKTACVKDAKVRYGQS